MGLRHPVPWYILYYVYIEMHVNNPTKQTSRHVGARCRAHGTPTAHTSRQFSETARGGQAGRQSQKSALCFFGVEN